MATDSPSKTSTFKISEEVLQIDRLISQWEEEASATDTRREARVKNVNVAEKQNRGDIGKDEVVIPRRVIDANIRREKPHFLAYIEQAPRLVLFRSRTDPARDTIALADWFTAGMRYQGWSEPWHRVFDSSSLHGGAFIEVRIDMGRPYKVELVYTPREMLIFPVKTRRTIQRCEKILRKYEFLPNELEDAVEDFEFNKEVVREVLENLKSNQRDEPLCVYKVFCKKNGVVYVFWYIEKIKDRWLKDPETLYMGVMNGERPAPITTYPFFSCLNEFVENELILATKGRAQRDLADQDALTQLWTATVNACNRAAEVYGSEVSSPMQLEGRQATPLVPNSISPRELVFFQPEWPDAVPLQVAQQLSSENQTTAGQINYAVANRKDARKTRAEIVAATDQASQLGSVQLVPAAVCITETYSFVWMIVQSLVMAGLIAPPPGILPFFEDQYDLMPAGDSEVVQRAEKIAALQQDIPLFANTPLYIEMLAKYVQLRFPDDAIRWTAILQSQNLAPIVQQLLQVISGIPPEAVPPETQQQIQAIMANATAAIQTQAGVSSGMASSAGNSSANPADDMPI